MRFCLLVISAFCSAIAIADENDILVIHSYHQGLFWTDSFQYGLEQQIEPYNLSTRVLYLDTKRMQDEHYLQQLYSLYRTKFEQESFHAIVVSDNTALELVNHLGDVIGDTPVIFGGINNYEPYLHRNINATGVRENVDLAANIALIERVQPQLESIYIITDHSITGAAAQSEIGKFMTEYPQYHGRIVSYIPDSFNQLLDFVAQLDERSAVIYWLYYRSRSGEVVSDTQVWKGLNQAAKAPIYMAHDYGLSYGAVGGVIQDGVQHGQQTGALLVKVLENPGSPLPPIEMGIAEIKLDYQAVQRWELGVEGEASAVLFNRPPSFTEKYRHQLEFIASLTGILILVIIGLVYYLGRMKRSEQLAKESQTLIEMVFDQSYHFIGVLDSQGAVISSNRKLHDLLHDQSFSIERPIWQHPHWENESAQQIKHYFNEPKQAQNAQFEVEIWHEELGAIVLELALKPIPSPSSELQFLLEARDITSRKVTEERLFQREANLSHYYDQQPVMMVTLDEHNRIQQVNQFAEQLLGYTEDQILGHRLREFYLHKDALIPRQVLLQPKQAIKGVWRRDIEYRHADGQTVWIRENIRPLVESGHLLIVGEDVTETRALAEQLKYQAEHDLLTGAYSRNYFETALNQALEEVKDCTRTHAMLYIDLDQLKVLNDTAGHEAGDAAIQFCASMLEDVLPYNTILARMGGDEFAILLNDCTELDAKKLATTIINTLSEQAFIWEDIRLSLTCSIGIRLIDHTASSPQMVHAQADTACHAAKEEGRNRYNLYCLDDKELRRREQEMESVNLVHHALANQRIELFAQRILDLSGEERGMHFEILIRIKNGQGEYISPGIFMPASERYNIAHLLDKQVVTQTLAFFEQHPQLIDKLALCSINLSGHSMGNSEFIHYLLDILGRTKVPCHKICLEITETAAMSNMNQAIEFFSQLKALGCQIALDDFGSGLSSFGYLKKLPVDIVKIDGIFVADMDSNEIDHLMVRSINDLAHQMGKKTVAEFVENSQIIEQLMELEVDYAQGYFIGKPKPLAELVEQLSVIEKA
ncbi:ABC transporter substrate binding protein [Vibrio sinaloensis]|uniref:ABC transporter substrate binding protein n=1 Tax=Photobacterium sp. (strain ATCC 43367) TaxID=379097 RepID=UPI00204C91E2|nr:ABC transporter substrate binding protein [Vibrio sinaloensis]UPQ89310.1 EAL domain-containing protein [Vibrio sinaloensis]